MESGGCRDLITQRDPVLPSQSISQEPPKAHSKVKHSKSQNSISLRSCPLGDAPGKNNLSNRNLAQDIEVGVMSQDTIDPPKQVSALILGLAVAIAVVYRSRDCRSPRPDQDRRASIELPHWQLWSKLVCLN